MTVEDRIALAKIKVETVLNLLRTLIQIRANNEFVVYSAKLAKQVGESYAANAFNVLTASLYETELIRLCAVWDAAQSEQQARDRNSLPAISWLLAPDEVVEALGARVKETRSNVEIRDLGPERDPGLRDSLTALQARRAKEEADRVKDRLRTAKANIAEIIASELHVGLKNFRDKHVAHSLVQTALDKKGKVAEAKYGHEKELLEKTIELTADLYYGVCDASFSWESAWSISRECSEALFSKAALNVVR